jgi:hypothetical protein
LPTVIKKKKKRNYKESKSQRDFFKWLKCYPAIRDMSFAIPNGGKRNAFLGKLMQLEGMTAGVPDIFVAIPINGWHGLFIEMKEIGNSLSPLQAIMMDRLTKRGYFCETCYGWEAAKDTVTRYIGDLRAIHKIPDLPN